MLGNTDFGSIPMAQAAAAAAVATNVCNELRPCFACVLDEFAAGLKTACDKESARLLDLYCVLLKQYINTFGAGLLAAKGTPITVLPGNRKAHSSCAVERYTSNEIAGLLRGFGLFYVLFKVDAPDAVKDVWWSLTSNLATWMIKRGYVSPQFELNFDPADDDARINAVCAAGLINQAGEPYLSEDFNFCPVREGEPFYLVSRTVPGKLWFLYSAKLDRCAEFGPVPVPSAASSMLQRGWGLDCKFISVNNRWHITKVEDVLPI